MTFPTHNDGSFPFVLHISIHVSYITYYYSCVLSPLTRSHLVLCSPCPHYLTCSDFLLHLFSYLSFGLSCIPDCSMSSLYSPDMSTLKCAGRHNDVDLLSPQTFTTPPVTPYTHTTNNDQVVRSRDMFSNQIPHQYAPSFAHTNIPLHSLFPLPTILTSPSII